MPKGFCNDRVKKIQTFEDGIGLTANAVVLQGLRVLNVYPRWNEDSRIPRSWKELLTTEWREGWGRWYYGDGVLVWLGSLRKELKDDTHWTKRDDVTTLWKVNSGYGSGTEDGTLFQVRTSRWVPDLGCYGGFSCTTKLYQQNLENSDKYEIVNR